VEDGGLGRHRFSVVSVALVLSVIWSTGVALAAPGKAMGGQPPTVGFVAAETIVALHSGRAEVMLYRSGAIENSSVVRVFTAGGSATPNIDYVPIDQTLTLAPGEPYASTDVTILDPGDPLEDATTVRLHIVPLTNARLTFDATAVLVISSGPPPDDGVDAVVIYNAVPSPPDGVVGTGEHVQFRDAANAAEDVWVRAANRFGAGVAGVTVTASADAGGLGAASAVTGSDGLAVFTDTEGSRLVFSEPAVAATLTFCVADACDTSNVFTVVSQP
jgi:hypothetical protein